MNREIVIWAAGFFDGEGNVATHRSGGVQVSVTQVVPEPLYLLQDTFGGSIYKRMPNGKKRNLASVWTLWGKEARIFLEAIRPYCMVKGPDIDQAISRE